MNTKTESGPRVNRQDEAKSPQVNGLVAYRARMAEARRVQIAELDRLRETAVTIMRDGKEFKVVTIPDKYAWKQSEAARLDSAKALA